MKKQQFAKRITIFTLIVSMILSLGVADVRTTYAMGPDGTTAEQEPDNITFGYDDVELVDGCLTVHDNLPDYTPIASKLLRAATVPASYDLRNVNGSNYLTGVKDQGGYGTCWAFTALGVAESNILRKHDVETDLSEYQLAYFLYNRVPDALGNTAGDRINIINNSYDYLTLGATNMWAMYELASWTGPIDENYAPYKTSTSSRRPLDSTYAYNKDAYHMQNARRVPMKNNITQIKQMLMDENYGPCAVGIKSVFNNSLYYNATYKASYQTGKACDHAVVIVGWDDNFSREKFNSNCRPSNNGAWLVRNSWGSNNDYSWISYEDASISNQTAIFYSYETTDKYDFNYQYDGGYALSFASVPNGSTFVNRYKAIGAAQEQINAVSFSLQSDNVDYSIQIYMNSSASNPLDGRPMLATPVTGTTTYTGYYTIPIPDNIQISQGDTFSVAVTLSDRNNSEVALYVDKSYEDAPVQYVSHTEAGQSYYIPAMSNTVYDVGGKTTDPYCPRIKAFTTASNGSHVHSFSSEVTKPATCNTEGSIKYSCNGCGYSYSYAISKLSHTYTKKVVSNSALKSSATTTSPAIYYYSCSVCGAVNNAYGAATFAYGNPLETPVPDVTVSYSTHVQNIGWQAYRSNGKMGGTSGRALRLEGIKIKVSGNSNLGISYRTHIQNIGWQDWKSDDVMSGTSGKALRLEAISIKLTGSDADKYNVYYRVHAQNYGWLGWAKNGENAGTANQSLRLEAIQVLVIKKGYVPTPGALGCSFVDLGKKAKNASNAGAVNYMTHVQNYGDQSYVYDGSLSGTTGEALRLEAIRINVNNSKAGVSGGITYRTHIQNDGWQAWRSDGEMSGTSGRALRLEAIEIKLTGNLANKYDVYYRVHCQNYGWLGWAKNGQTSGTSGMSLRLEGIQVVLLPKGSTPPNYLPGKVNMQSYIQR